MSKLYRILLNAFTVAAFAEAGEFDTARQLLQIDTSAPPTTTSDQPPSKTGAGSVRRAAPAI